MEASRLRGRALRKVLLDTNFLLLPHTEKLDIFEELERLLEEGFELLVPSSVVEELRKLQEGKGEAKAAAKVALELLLKKGVRVLPTDLRPDEFIVRFVKENKHCVVCTNDKQLKRRVRGVASIISVRDGSKLGFS